MLLCLKKTDTGDDFVINGDVYVVALPGTRHADDASVGLVLRRPNTNSIGGDG